MRPWKPLRSVVMAAEVFLCEGLSLKHGATPRPMIKSCGDNTLTIEGAAWVWAKPHHTSQKCVEW